MPRPKNGGFDIGAYEFCSSPIIIACLPNVVIMPTEMLTVQVSPAGAGITDPAEGMFAEVLNSLVAIKATTKPGFSFSQWTGNALDPLSASTEVYMNINQTVTANFVPGNTTLGGNILTKSGPSNGRVWPINVSDAGVVVAHNSQITNFTLTQTAGTACTPALYTALPVLLGDVLQGVSTTANLIFDFTDCAASARFTALATFSANGGGVTGSMSRTNQFQ